jgi:hypothetical protein
MLIFNNCKIVSEKEYDFITGKEVVDLEQYKKMIALEHVDWIYLSDDRNQW